MISKEDFKIVNANFKEKEIIFNIYQSVLNQQGCTWDENYPSIENIITDIKNKSLYCLKNKKSEILAVATLETNKRLEKIFNSNFQRKYLLTRVCVKRELQGVGIGKILLTKIEEEALKKKINIIYLLVNKNNIKARKLYELQKYYNIGEIFEFNKYWDIMQKKIENKEENKNV